MISVTLSDTLSDLESSEDMGFEKSAHFSLEKASF